MKGKRLGRGLEEVSQVFLSSEETKSSSDISFPTLVSEPAFKRQFSFSSHRIAVTGGSADNMGTYLLCNISIELARQGYRVLVVDDDPGSFNVTRLMGLMEMDNQAESAFTHAPMGVRVTSHTSFLNDLMSQDSLAHEEEPLALPKKYQKFDYLLFHLPHSQLGEMGPLLRQISLCIFVTPADGQSMLECYAVIKELHQRARQIRPGLAVCSEKGEQEASETFFQMARNVRRFLHKDLISYAFFQHGEEAVESIEERAPLVLKKPCSENRRLLFNISGLIVEDFTRKLASGE
jgi:MinD-like ATPase involved in chromosome partitioning or flagellar assembly